MARMHSIEYRQSPKNKQFYVSIKGPNGEPLFDGCEGHVKNTQHKKMVAKLISAFTDGKFKIVDTSVKSVPKTTVKVAPKVAVKAKGRVTIKRVRKITPSVSVAGPSTQQ